MEHLKIAYIQTHLIWENSSANLKKFEKLVDQIEKSDLIILPEMFNTGFTMNAKEVSQAANGEVVQWLIKKAEEKNCAVIGSSIINENNKYYNRCILAKPQSKIEYYDKRHLFRMGNEHKTFEAGTRTQIFNYKQWRIRPLICYDLRFPIWSRNQDNYDILVYIANWPGARSDVWKTLLKARAIENQCYVVGVNRIGSDGMGINYKGHSMIINAKGEIISEVSENCEDIGISTLSLSELNDFREKFPVHLDADNFQILD
ncbi:MAG: amidohydrolase [Salinivirgaceae bacterium]|jgi:omega-amidase|nr:amidohydrolase [Salinivirgaceae bacterium]